MKISKDAINKYTYMYIYTYIKLKYIKVKSLKILIIKSFKREFNIQAEIIARYTIQNNDRKEAVRPDF